MAVYFAPRPLGGPASIGAALGTFLGNAGGQVLDQYTVNQEMQKTADLPDDQKWAKWQQDLGQRGALLAKQAIGLKLGQMQLDAGKADLQLSNLKVTRAQKDLDNYDTNLALTRALQKSEFDRNEAAARGSIAGAAEAGARSLFYRSQISKMNADTERENRLAPLQESLLQAQVQQLQTQSALIGGLLGGSDVTQPQGGTGSGQPQPQPQSAPAPDVAPDFRPTPIGAPGGGPTAQPLPNAAAGGGGRTLSDGPIVPAAGTPEGLQRNQSILTQLDQGQTPQISVYDPSKINPMRDLNPSERIALGLAMKSPAEQARILMEHFKPVNQQDEILFPGVKAKIGTLPNGQRVYLSGIQDERKPMTDSERANQQGVAQMFTAIETIDKIRQGQDLGPQATRLVNEALRSMGQPGLGKGATAQMAIDSMMAHIILPVMSYARGNRPTDTLREQMLAIIPSLKASGAVAHNVAQTSFAVLAPMIKDLIDTSRQEGKHVDSQLEALYQSLGLGDPKLDITKMLQNAEMQIAGLPTEMKTSAFGGKNDPMVRAGNKMFRWSEVDKLSRAMNQSVEDTLNDLAKAPK